jgi:S1-C subfamily serine protease
MNGNEEGFEKRAALIQRLADYLYGRVGPERAIDLRQVTDQLRDDNPEVLKQLLRKLDALEILEFDGRENIRLRIAGKNLYEKQCMPETILGLNYSDAKYSPAVVRIVVRKPDGVDVSGTGFFIADPPNSIITNRHVVFGNKILHIDNSAGQRVWEGELPSVLGPEDLDIAAIQCATPEDIMPIRIDWAADSVRPLDEVLVLGYPYVAFHEPALHHAKGKVGSRPRRLAGPGQEVRDSLIISDVAAPGCSGGPVISMEGRVVGIVAGEVGAEGENIGRQIFISVIPSHYLREVFRQ